MQICPEGVEDYLIAGTCMFGGLKAHKHTLSINGTGPHLAVQILFSLQKASFFPISHV